MPFLTLRADAEQSICPAIQFIEISPVFDVVAICSRQDLFILEPVKVPRSVEEKPLE